MKDIIEQAEKAVNKIAAKKAYEITQAVEDPKIQKSLYTIYRDSMILGARLMQEEMNRIISRN